MDKTSTRKPPWLRKTISFSQQKELNQLFKKSNINTICQEAKCPNISECFSKKQATFMILGNICTRNCSYCDVDYGMPKQDDINKDLNNIIDAIKVLNLNYVVITSPTRDDLKDGGAEAFCTITKEIKKINNAIKIELLIPEFKNSKDAICEVARCGADVIGHNIETIKRRYDIRQAYTYNNSLNILKQLSSYSKNIKTKTGVMLGFGESKDEMIELFSNLLDVDCKFLSMGQYLAPSGNYEKVVEYVKPEVFLEYKNIAYEMGFSFVHSSPYTRSSYMAHTYLE
jgi:lipoic acid synthetase